MAYIDVDMDVFSDQEVFEDAVNRLNYWKNKAGKDETSKKKLISLITEINNMLVDEQVITTVTALPDASILDIMKRELLERAANHYTLDELEGLLPLATFQHV